MSDRFERRQSILVVEDQQAVASLLGRAIAEGGWRLVGPAPTISAARELMVKETVDAAILTYIADGEHIDPLADELRRRDVPIAITTGMAEHVRPQFPDVPVIVKPFQRSHIVEVLRTLLKATVGS